MQERQVDTCRQLEQDYFSPILKTQHMETSSGEPELLSAFGKELAG